MIRLANISDVKDIAWFISGAAKESKILPRSVEEILDVVAHQSFFLWIEHGEIIGCCSLEIYSHKLAEIRSLYVVHSHRDRGIGTNLIKAAIKKAKEQKVYEILSVTDHVDLFHKCGFRRVLDNQTPLFLKP